MKRIVIAACLTLGSAAAGIAACDLFHSTDFATMCDLSPHADGCAPEAAPIAEAGFDGNFCSWSSQQALANAQHACAWLGACEGPLGENAFGPCMIRALPAYDCSIDRARPVLGALHAFWDALWQAKSCADVDRVVFPGGAPLCGGSNFVCGPGAGSNTRAECGFADAAVIGENCLLSGRACAGPPGAVVCAGHDGVSCAGTRCDNSLLHDCGDAGPEAGQDNGIDCSLYGAGKCGMTAAGPACLPASDAGCDASAAITCGTGSLATGCPGGFRETVSCPALTMSCDPTAVTAPWDVASACTAGACDAGDSCTGMNKGVESCARGTSLGITCSNEGLGPCSLVNTQDGPRAACGRPGR